MNVASRYVHLVEEEAPYNFLTLTAVGEARL